MRRAMMDEIKIAVLHRAVELVYIRILFHFQVSIVQIVSSQIQYSASI